MARYVVGSVPYLNAKPLVKPLIWAGETSEVDVEFEVPSLLPPLLEQGRVQAIMVSSISVLMDPRATVAGGLSISTQSDVLSVRLFSSKPFDQIESLAEDQSSMTSNALAKILLAERYGIVPRAEPAPPNGDQMLETHDACVLIGDNGMRYEGKGLQILDLGRAWRELTVLPFVWAVWKGLDTLTPDLVGRLQWSLETSYAEMERVIDEATEETGFTRNQCENYLTKIMDYRLTSEHLEGLRTYGRLLKKHGLLSEVYEPKVIEAVEPASVR